MKKKLTPKQQVKKRYISAMSRQPRPGQLYYGHWTVIIPPTACGIFGVMTRVLGHGDTPGKAWADAASRNMP